MLTIYLLRVNGKHRKRLWMSCSGRVSSSNMDRGHKMSTQPEKITWMIASLRIQKEQLEMEYAGVKVTQEKQIFGMGVVLDYRLTRTIN
jgi:hypothetical protein